MATSTIHEQLPLRYFKYSITFDDNGWAVSPVTRTLYFPIGIICSTRSGWLLQFSEYFAKSNDKWCIKCQGATSSSGTFEGVIVAVPYNFTKAYNTGQQ